VCALDALADDGWAATLSLAAGYAGPLVTERAAFGPAGRRRSLEKLPPRHRLPRRLRRAREDAD
jgi:hypothetical protein